MRLGVMQPYFFPYIGYWQLMNLVDEYVIYDDVNYIKGGWINRNNILLNGQAKMINLHIKDASPNRLIKDTQLSQTEINTRKLLATISQAYRKAPCFEPVYHMIETILKYNETNLSNYLANQIKTVKDYLGIQTTLHLSSEIPKKADIKGEAKIINICENMGADCYINAIGGMQLYNQENFRKCNLKLQFLKTGDISYHQYKGEFVPNLSIIDVMMFNTVEEIADLLQKYTLIEPS